MKTVYSPQSTVHKKCLCLCVMILWSLLLFSHPAWASEPPVFQAITDITVNPSIGQSTQASFTVVAADPESTLITLSLHSIIRDGAVIYSTMIRNFSFDPNTGVFIWNPRPSASGTYVFTFRAVDQQGDSADLSVNITVTTPAICNGSDSISTFLKNEAINPHGYTGIVYRNADGGHATASTSWSSQLDVRQESWGLQLNGFPGEITFTNSSTAYYALGGDNNAAGMKTTNANILYNNLINPVAPLFGFYPGHISDGRAPWGIESHFAKNIYTFCTIGSSSSELTSIVAYMKAAGAFQKDVFKYLMEKGALMTTLIYLDRFTRVDKDEARYMTLEAHPSFFPSATLKPLDMVRAANAMTIEKIPPIARIDLTMWPDQGINGINYFEEKSTSPLRIIASISPMSVATFYRDIYQTTKIFEVYAGRSFSPNDSPVTEYNWVVTKGDPAKIRIIPVNPNHSRVRIEVDYHTEQPVPFRTGVNSNLMEVALFVRNANGQISLPAFFTSYSMRNEERQYQDGKIQQITYNVNPVPDEGYPIAISYSKNWTKDVFNYDAEGSLLGWDRTMRTGAIVNYTADGKMVISGVPTNVEYTYDASMFYIKPNAIEPGLPKVSISPDIQVGSPGGTLNFTITISNQDSAICQADIFSLALFGYIPSDWTQTFQPSTISIPPSGEGIVNWQIGIPPGVNEGTYSIEAKINGTLAGVNHNGIGLANVSFSTITVLGDVSGDGIVNAYDAALVAQAAVGLRELTPEQAIRADVSGEGIVSAYDAALIAQYVVGLRTEFPVEE